MKNKLLVVVGLLFLVAGYLVGQTSKNLSMYGCTAVNHTYLGNNYETQVCIVYDPNTDKHFVVANSTGGGVAMVEEK